LKTCAIEPVSNFNLAALTREGETLKLGRAVTPSRRKRCQDRIGRARLDLSGEGRGQSMHTLGDRVGQLSAQFCRVVTVEKVGVGAAAQELRMAKDSDQQFAVGVQPVDVSARQHCRQTSCRLLAGGSVDDDLGQHRVVMDCDFRPVFEAGVDTDGREDVLRLIADQPESVQRPGRRQEIVARILRVEPGFDGVPAGRSAGNCGLQRIALRDANLRSDQIDPGDHLGDRVLDLQPGVHLQEVEFAGGIEQKLNRPCAGVADRFCGLDRRFHEPGSQVLIDGGGR
jgi:hypothetical protein